MKLFLGIIIPFIGTSFGALMVFFMKNKINSKIEKLLLGFASGVMISASIWSLIIPALEMSEKQQMNSCIPVNIGFIIGILFLMIMDSILLYLQENKNIILKNKKTSMLVLAVTLHNIPEGMAVGVAFASVLNSNTGINMMEAFALAIGIAIQNFPEGAIISMPLKSDGMSKVKAFWYGTLSGIVEPIFAVITILLTSTVEPILPYILSFAAGAMVYVVVNELIPESQKEEKMGRYGIIGVTLGFLIMMSLDVTLG